MGPRRRIASENALLGRRHVVRETRQTEPCRRILRVRLRSDRCRSVGVRLPSERGQTVTRSAIMCRGVVVSWCRGVGRVAGARLRRGRRPTPACTDGEWCAHTGTRGRSNAVARCSGDEVSWHEVRRSCTLTSGSNQGRATSTPANPRAGGTGDVDRGSTVRYADANCTSATCNQPLSGVVVGGNALSTRLFE